MRKGETPEDLPAPETHECRVCNVSVKYLKEHLKNAHKITEQEYESLFDDDITGRGSRNGDVSGPNDSNQMVVTPPPPPAMVPAPGAMMSGRQIPKPPPLTPKPQLKIRQPTPEVVRPPTSEVKITKVESLPEVIYIIFKYFETISNDQLHMYMQC